MPKGLDCDHDLSNFGGHLLQEGYKWVGRYINTNKPQHLTKAEAQTLSDKDLFIVSLWEKGFPTTVTYFTPARATSDGNGAVAQARAITQPMNTPIYFAVDYDASEEDLEQITAYFASVHAIVRAAGYFVGVYGSGLVCQHLIAQGFVSFTWLSQSRGFADYLAWLHHANIVQGITATVEGLDVDLDVSTGNAGGWKLSHREA